MNMSCNAKGEKADMTSTEDDMTEERFLEAYKKKEYPKPALTADIAIFRHTVEGVEVLLIKRGRHPFKGCWALPGGFANPDEDVIDAAQRELEEETGIVGVSVELFGIYGAPGRDPRGWTVSGGFCSIIDKDIDIKAGDDAADASWCKVSETVSSQAPKESATDAGKNPDEKRILSVECPDGETPFVYFALVPQRLGAPRARVLDSNGFAFDHAQLLADAYLKAMR